MLASEQLEKLKGKWIEFIKVDMKFNDVRELVESLIDQRLLEKDAVKDIQKVPAKYEVSKSYSAFYRLQISDIATYLSIVSMIVETKEVFEDDGKEPEDKRLREIVRVLRELGFKVQVERRGHIETFKARYDLQEHRSALVYLFATDTAYLR